MNTYRSKVEQLARVLRIIALLLLLMWLIAAGAALAWVDDEFQGDADFWRYITAVADVGTFLIAAVLAYVGSAIVQAVGRVRSSVIQAMYEITEPAQAEEEPVGW